MSEEERKFLEIVDLKKGFGSGETRQEVLRGMNFSVAKVLCCEQKRALYRVVQCPVCVVMPAQL